MKSTLEPVIAEAFADAELKFGDLGLDFYIYCERVLSIVHKHLGPSPAANRAIDYVRRLNCRDLYLATACAQSGLGVAPSSSPAASTQHFGLAWKALEVRYKGLVCDLVRFFYRRSLAADDLADNILTDLFLPDRRGRSRIASYDGRSSLSTWLRVVVCNRSINARRARLSENTVELEPALPDKPALANIELAVRARRYGTVLEDSLASACLVLTPRERLILLWRYQDGLQLGEIAQLLGIHQSNVTRQLERLQNKLRDDVTTILSDKHGLSQSAIHECLEDMVENPHHQIPVLDFLRAMQETGEKNQSMVLSSLPSAQKEPGSMKALSPRLKQA
ncbi:MAG TPA: sigma-70 family RNA polymerase sigma factor [Candidatus Angelobacter sp.]